MLHILLGLPCGMWLLHIPVISCTEIKPVNLALNVDVRQNSHYTFARQKSYAPELAVDGDVNNFLDKDGCARTDTFTALDAWMEITLKKTYRIGEVKILTKVASGAQLHDFRIDVYENKRRPRKKKNCITHAGPVGTGWFNFPCESPVIGRYVRITKPKKDLNDSLILCEVEVYEGSLCESKTYEVSAEIRSRLYKRKPIGVSQGVSAISSSPLHCGYMCGVITTCRGFKMTAKEDGALWDCTLIVCAKHRGDADMADNNTVYYAS